MIIERREVCHDEYQSMMREAFGKDTVDLPGTVFVMKNDDGEAVAFCSAYPHNVSTLYLQHIGFLNGQTKRYAVFAQFIDFLFSLGVPFIMGAIDNSNKVALMWAIRNGFKIIGTRQASDKTLYVEIMRGVRDGL